MAPRVLQQEPTKVLVKTRVRLPLVRLRELCLAWELPFSGPRTLNKKPVRENGWAFRNSVLVAVTPSQQTRELQNYIHCRTPCGAREWMRKPDFYLLPASTLRTLGFNPHLATVCLNAKQLAVAGWTYHPLHRELSRPWPQVRSERLVR
jgi:hypothetical protein